MSAGDAVDILAYGEPMVAACAANGQANIAPVR